MAPPLSRAIPFAPSGFLDECMHVCLQIEQDLRTARGSESSDIDESTVRSCPRL